VLHCDVQHDLGLYPYQVDMLRDPDPMKVLRWCRRSGKTLMLAGYCIWYAMTHPRSTIIVCMPKFNQTKEIFFQSDVGLHSHIERMDLDVRRAFVEEQLQTAVKFRNGSKVLAEVPEPYTIRGHGPHVIVLDEFNFFRDDKELWLSALAPMTLTRIVPILVASTPWNTDSIYYEMCYSKDFDKFSGNVYHDFPQVFDDNGKLISGYDPEHPENFKPRYLRTWRDNLQPNGTLIPDQVEQMRKQYSGDPWRWAREMESEFISDATSFIPMSLLTRCQSKEDWYNFANNPTGMFGLGWDLGRDNDHGCVSIVERFSDYVRCVFVHVFPVGTPYTEQLKFIKDLQTRWRFIEKVVYDHTGTKGTDELIAQVGLEGVEGLDFTNPNKHAMAMLLKQLMMSPRASDAQKPEAEQRRRFEMPFNDEVFAQFNLVRWEQKEGSEIYTFSHPEGTHDDIFWATCLAVQAARQVVHRNIKLQYGLGKVHATRIWKNVPYNTTWRGRLWLFKLRVKARMKALILRLKQ
jgi:phage FluMu gp28-like protein